MADTINENIDQISNNRPSGVYTKNIGPYILSKSNNLIKVKPWGKEHLERLNMELTY